VTDLLGAPNATPPAFGSLGGHGARRRLADSIVGPRGTVGHADAVDTRLPDFLLIGAMKAGTTSLFRWLGEHPGAALPAVKEPEILLGPGDPRPAYRDLFAHLPPDVITGEASARYGHPAEIATVVHAVERWLPDTRLVYLVRDPEQRLRSHYRHECQRGRERRSLAEATTAPDSPYVAHSRYHDVISPIVEGLGASRLTVVRFEELMGDQGETWSRLLDDLGLHPFERPSTRHNTSDDKGQFRPFMRLLHDRGLVERVGRLRLPTGRLRRLLVDDSDAARRRLDAAAGAPLPDVVRAQLELERQRLASLID